MIYRTKPAEVDAVRWDGRQFLDHPDWLVQALALDAWELGSIKVIGPHAYLRMRAQSPAVQCRAGEFIVREADGRLRVDTYDRFTACYEPAPGLTAAADHEAP